MPTISRQEHAALFGPTVGDKIRLGDTDLFVEIEKDLRHYGDESMYGGGKTLRGGMGGDARLNRDAGVLDLVITNVTVIDAVQGVIKADVGIRDGRIVGIGKSGNPSMMNGVDPDLIVGNSTDAITGQSTHPHPPAACETSRHLPLPCNRGYAALLQRRDHLLRRRRRPHRRHQRNDHYPRPVEYQQNARSHRRHAGEPWASSARGTPTTAFRWSNRSRPARAASRCMRTGVPCPP